MGQNKTTGKPQALKSVLPFTSGQLMFRTKKKKNARSGAQDFMCPWSLIGLRSLALAKERFAARLDFAVELLPFEFDPPGTYPQAARRALCFLLAVFCWLFFVGCFLLAVFCWLFFVVFPFRLLASCVSPSSFFPDAAKGNSTHKFSLWRPVFIPTFCWGLIPS